MNKEQALITMKANTIHDLGCKLQADLISKEIYDSEVEEVERLYNIINAPTNLGDVGEAIEFVGNLKYKYLVETDRKYINFINTLPQFSTIKKALSQRVITADEIVKEYKSLPGYENKRVEYKDGNFIYYPMDRGRFINLSMTLAGTDKNGYSIQGPITKEFMHNISTFFTQQKEELL